jgi:CBS domain-containing membrane protein
MKDPEPERSLALDLEKTGRGEKERTVARVAVVGTRGFTRDGSDATITSDCANAAALEHEIARLHGELDDALERGRAVLAGEAHQVASRRPSPSRPDPLLTGDSERKRPQLTVPWTVADLMTRSVRTVGPNEPVATARAAMEAGGFRHLVVVAEDGAIAGVLSHRDLFFGPLSWSIGLGKKAYESLLETARVKDVMHSDVVTVDPATPLRDAAALLREHKIGCLPVVEGDWLAGLVTEGDLVALIADA